MAERLLFFDLCAWFGFCEKYHEAVGRRKRLNPRRLESNITRESIPCVSHGRNTIADHDEGRFVAGHSCQSRIDQTC
jgi:hypothetical protein